MEGITSAEGSSTDRPTIFVNLIIDFRDAGLCRSALTNVEIGFIDVDRPLGLSSDIKAAEMSRTGVGGERSVPSSMALV